jgi:murein DD-endopeptidase MepM/ murein hydrolase activator NlpD
MKKILESRWFIITSWGLTILLVAGLLGFAWRQLQNPPVVAAAPMPTAKPTEALTDPSAVPVLDPAESNESAITRQLQLKTNIPERPRTQVVDYTVLRGDSVFGISKEFSIKPDTLLWANYDVLNDTPDSLRVGQELRIPATDGVYYEIKAGDTLQKIADDFSANVDDIITFEGNNLDLTDPQIKPGQWIMVPGGHREFKQWLIPTIASGRSGTANVGASACGGGPVGSGAFVWPADNHYLSGNDYWSGHLGIDLAAGEGAAVYAADSGVVTMASVGWNGGYGNVIQIDHGNSYSTLYAHLSQINVSVCQGVYVGQLIGLAGNTGNSFGAHLHFEVRQNGGFINPWYVLP